jgi:hypothetical protein
MAHEFDLALIQPNLDLIFDAYEKEKGFVAVLYEDDIITIRFTSLQGIDVSTFSAQVVTDESGEYISIPVVYEEGPEIVPSLGRIGVDIPYSISRSDNFIRGGEQIGNIIDGYYGTLGLMIQRISYNVQGRRGKKTCTTRNAVISNNHVLARSDRGQIGELIWVRETTNELGKLHCYIPFKIYPDLDFATAQLSHTNQIKFWEIHQIGEINNRFVTPKRNEKVKKFGATTGFKTGTVTGITNIVAGGYSYKGVYITSRGFSCAGDSGALIISTANNILGMHSWGDDVERCDQNPRGYFYTFNIAKKASGTAEASEAMITASQDYEEETKND